jgi:hypothetical protein
MLNPGKQFSFRKNINENYNFLRGNVGMSYPVLTLFCGNPEKYGSALSFCLSFLLCTTQDKTKRLLNLILGSKLWSY